ncbi:MAG: hypothetical protein AAB373_05985 [Patescibacteria group bacterium]
MERIAQIVEDLARNMPFNNFRNVMASKGRTCPDQIGRNCHDVNRLLNQQLGGNLEFIQPEGSDHSCSIYESAEGPILLDPSARILEPIPLKALLDGNVKVIKKPALPMVAGKPTTITITKTGKATILLTKTHFQPPNNEVVDLRQFYNLKKRIKLPAEDYVHKPSINKFSPLISTPTPDGKLLILTQFPPQGPDAQISGGLTRTEYIPPDRVDDVISSVSQIIGLARGPLLETLEEGSRLYYSMRTTRDRD